MEIYTVEIKQVFKIEANSKMEAVCIGDDYIKNNFMKGNGEMVNAEISLHPMSYGKAISNIRNLADYR